MSIVMSLMTKSIIIMWKMITQVLKSFLNVLVDFRINYIQYLSEIDYDKSKICDSDSYSDSDSDDESGVDSDDIAAIFNSDSDSD